MKTTLIATTLAVGAAAQQAGGVVFSYGNRVGGAVVRRPATGGRVYAGTAIVRPATTAVAAVEAEENEALEWNSDLQEARYEFGEAVDAFKGMPSETFTKGVWKQKELYNVADELATSAALPGSAQDLSDARAEYHSSRSEESYKNYQKAYWDHQDTASTVAENFANRYNNGYGAGVASIMNDRAEYKAALVGDDQRKIRDKGADYYYSVSKRLRGATSKLSKVLNKNKNIVEVDDDTNDYNDAKEAVLEARKLFREDPTSEEARIFLEAAMVEYRKERWNMLHHFAEYTTSGVSPLARFIRLMKYRAALQVETLAAFGPESIPVPTAVRSVYGNGYGRLMGGSSSYYG